MWGDYSHSSNPTPFFELNAGKTNVPGFSLLPIRQPKILQVHNEFVGMESKPYYNSKTSFWNLNPAVCFLGLVMPAEVGWYQVNICVLLLCIQV